MWEHNTEWVYIDHWDYFATFLINNAHHDNINRVLLPFHDQLLYVLANALRVIHPTREIRQTTEGMRDRIFGPYKYLNLTACLASFVKRLILLGHGHYRNEGILGIHLRTTHPEIPVTDELMVPSPDTTRAIAMRDALTLFPHSNATDSNDSMRAGVGPQGVVPGHRGQGVAREVYPAAATNGHRYDCARAIPQTSGRSHI